MKNFDLIKYNENINQELAIALSEYFEPKRTFDDLRKFVLEHYHEQVERTFEILANGIFSREDGFIVYEYLMALMVYKTEIYNKEFDDLLSFLFDHYLTMIIYTKESKEKNISHSQFSINTINNIIDTFARIAKYVDCNINQIIKYSAALVIGSRGLKGDDYITINDTYKFVDKLL